VDAIAEKLDTKLGKWKPEISQEVRALVSQVIDAADNDALDVMRSRAAEQEVLDQLDERPSEDRGQKTEVRRQRLEDGSQRKLSFQDNCVPKCNPPRRAGFGIGNGDQR